MINSCSRPEIWRTWSPTSRGVGSYVWDNWEECRRPERVEGVGWCLRVLGCQSRYLASSVSQGWQREGWGCRCRSEERRGWGTGEGVWLALHSEPRWSIVETSLPSFSFSRCVSLISLSHPPSLLTTALAIGYARMSHPLPSLCLFPSSPLSLLSRDAQRDPHPVWGGGWVWGWVGVYSTATASMPPLFVSLGTWAARESPQNGNAAFSSYLSPTLRGGKSAEAAWYVYV